MKGAFYFVSIHIKNNKKNKAGYYNNFKPRTIK